ncbi:MAG: HEAT repeat domain-containing protein [Spirochaetia bacterium]|nr:HEAT repeat domain-containing protein [Spirochaetia bacterium]
MYTKFLFLYGSSDRLLQPHLHQVGLKVLLLGMLLLFTLVVQPLLAQETSETETENEKEEISLEEQRKLTIKYGIDSQILELISQLKDQKNDDYLPELEEQFSTTSNTNIKASIVGLFESLENDGIVDEAFEQLKEYDDLEADFVLDLIHYIDEYQTDSITAVFYEMLDDPRTEVASAALKAIGESEREQYAQKLLDLYEDQLFRDALKAPLITALGELGDPEAFEMLDRIVSDEDQSKSLRWRACLALGKIGGDKAFESVSQLLNDDDPILRSYAVSALGYFDQDGTVKILIDALRDGMWRVRVQAAEALGRRQANEALDILKYKAEYDPDIRNVRLTAVRAIGKLDSREGYNFLRELYSSQKTPAGLRTAAIKILVEEDLKNSLNVINEVFEEEWGKDKSSILDYTCKMLSTKESNSLAPLYKKMLNHPSHINLLYYGLRGVRLNKVGSLRAEVEDLTAKNVSRGVQSLAKKVLEEL